jgi:hypothetical protein
VIDCGRQGGATKGGETQKTLSFIRNDSLPARLGSPAGCIVAQPAGASDVDCGVEASLAAQNKSKSAVKTTRTRELRLDLGAARDFMVVAI